MGMTGQQLRHELESVDFGVKPTDREIPDNLAQGIVRFIARKHKLDIDIDELFGTQEGTEEQAPAEDDAQPEEEEQDEEVVESAPAAEKKESSSGIPKESSVGPESLNVLRKLNLDNVSKEAIAKEQEKLDAQQPSKKQLEEQKHEDKAMNKKKPKTVVQEQIKKKEGTVLLPDLVTVKEFAEKTGIQVPKVIQALMNSGVMVTINQSIDYDTAAIVAAELGVDVKKEESVADAEDLFSRNLEQLLADEPENLVERPPVVVVMGHVDHGKTSILDSIRQTDIVAGEAGGITQHIGAYQIVHAAGDEKHAITFLDTPGHEAFTAMRARGAQVTDIAIIVVAADEGIKPTTVEAINHAKEAGVPIIVAINKMDKENADPEKVKGELAAYDLQPEDWGGKTPTILCSATTKMGIDELLETIVLLAKMNDVKANPNRSAIATVVESHLDPSLGALATVVINTGTLKVSDPFVCGSTYGKVRAMMEAHGARLESVGPAGAVRLSGFDGVPEVGEILQVVSSEQQARNVVQEMQKIGDSMQKRSFADLVSRLSEGKLNLLRIVLKADTQGSLEAIREALAHKATEEVSVKVIHAAVGSVSENDVMMAAASDGIVIAFHAPVSNSVKRTAEREGVKVQEYDVVYALLDEIDALLQGLVEPVEEEQILGHLEVKEVFLTKKKEQIVGGKVTDGVIKRLAFRLMRGGEQVGEGRITSLRRIDKDIKEAKEGSECGMRVETGMLIEVDDILEVYHKELKRKKA